MFCHFSLLSQYCVIHKCQVTDRRQKGRLCCVCYWSGRQPRPELGGQSEARGGSILSPWQPRTDWLQSAEEPGRPGPSPPRPAQPLTGLCSQARACAQDTFTCLLWWDGSVQCAVAVFACISMNQSLLGSLAPPPLCHVRLVLSGRHRFMTLSNTGPLIFYIILEWKMCSEYWYLCMNTLHDWAWQFFLAEPSLHFSDRIMTR